MYMDLLTKIISKYCTFTIMNQTLIISHAINFGINIIKTVIFYYRQYFF